MATPEPNQLEKYEPNTALAAADPIGTEAASAAVAARARAEVEARTLMALRNPRNVNDFERRMLAACERFTFADAAQYEIKRGNKPITGLSIRFAEECARNYKNLDISSYLITETPTVRVLKVTVVDLETTIVWSSDLVIPKTVERSYIKAGDEVLGKRLNSESKTVYSIRSTDDETQFKQNRELAKVVRNLILAHIPSEIRELCEERIDKTVASLGDLTPEQFRDKIVASFVARGISRDDLEQFVGKSMTSASMVEVQELRRMLVAIKSGESTFEKELTEKLATRGEAPKPKGDDDKPTGGMSALRKAVTKPADEPAQQVTIEEPPPAEAPPEPEAPALDATIPARIQNLIDAEKKGRKLTDIDADDLRQYRMDNAHLFPEAPTAD